MHAFILAASLVGALLPEFSHPIAVAAVAVVDDPVPAGGTAFSVGAGLAWPEVALLYGSVWLAPDFTLDGIATLATANAGGTWHAPLGSGHAILVQGLVGYTHSLVHSSFYNVYHGMRLFAGAGYGIAGAWDFRAVLGLSAQQTAVSSWSYTPAAFLMLGKVF